MGVVKPLDLAISLRRDDDLTALLDDFFVQMIGVVSLVGERCSRFKSINEFVCAGDIVFLSWASNEPDWIAKRIARSMDFGTQTST
jgi:hypothetical protein